MRNFLKQLAFSMLIGLLLQAGLRAETEMLSPEDLDILAMSPDSTFVYIPSAVREALGFLHNEGCDGISDLCNLLAEDRFVANQDVAAPAIARAINTLREHTDSPEHLRMLATLLTYNEAIASGDAVITVEFDETAVTRSSSCCKPYCKYKVFCNVLIEGSLTVNGNERILGNLIVGGNEFIGGDLTVRGTIFGPTGAFLQGPTGPAGATGVTGQTGATGFAALTQFSMFYGLTAGTGNGGPTDYAAVIAPKTAAGTGRVPFPRNGPITGTIARIDASSFNLPTIGTYEITFRVHTTEPGQLQLELNGADLAETVAVNMNPTIGGHPIIGSFFVTTSVINSVLAVINPAGNSPALTVTPADGASTHANSQSITIKLLA